MKTLINLLLVLTAVCYIGLILNREYREGFADCPPNHICIPYLSINATNATIIIFVIALPMAIIAFIAWNYENPLLLKSPFHIVSNYFFKSSITNEGKKIE